MNKATASVGFLVSFAAGGTLIWGLNHGNGGSGSATKEPTGAPQQADKQGAVTRGEAKVNPGAAKVELFVMSQCPYGVQAEALFTDVVKKLGNDLDFHVEFIGSKTPTGELSSMHGPKELKGDIVQSCAMKHAPTGWFDLVACQNENYKEVDSNWRACSEKLGLPTAQIASCADGAEGQELVAASFDRAKQKGASGSPTILINGVKYAGARRSGDILRAVCNSYTGAKPAACSEIPEPPAVAVTVLTDARCKECDAKKVETQLRQKVGNPVIKTVDYQTPEGRQLFDTVKPRSLPALVFDASLDKDADAKAALGRGLRQAGDLRVSESGSFNPVCADDGGCATDACKLTLQCREQAPEAAEKLELFVMSQCPFGVKALDSMKEVLANFDKNGKDIDLSIHYIPQGEPSDLKSMHGQAEVDEDIRGVCAMKHYPQKLKYMDYIWCRNKDIKSANWEACTGGDTGIETKVIADCASGPEGKQLLLESFEYAKKSGIGSSPTWIANNKFKFSGIDAETVKTNLCSHNADLGSESCNAKLSGPPPRPANKAGAAAAQPGCG